MSWPRGVLRQSLTAAALTSCALAVSLAALVHAQQPAPQTPATQALAAPGRGGRGAAPLDPRVQIRTYKYIEVAGGDHGSVIISGQPDMFAFFAEHTKAR